MPHSYIWMAYRMVLTERVRFVVATVSRRAACCYRYYSAVDLTRLVRLATVLYLTGCRINGVRFPAAVGFLSKASRPDRVFSSRRLTGGHVLRDVGAWLQVKH
jgi:hypothetical protein